MIYKLNVYHIFYSRCKYHVNSIIIMCRKIANKNVRFRPMIELYISKKGAKVYK